MATNQNKGGTKTLRLTAEQEEHLQRIMTELGYASASKVIPRLFRIYDEHKATKQELRELRIKYNNLETSVEKVRKDFSIGLSGLLQFLFPKKDNDVSGHTDAEMDFLLKHPYLIDTEM